MKPTLATFFRSSPNGGVVARHLDQMERWKEVEGLNQPHNHNCVNLRYYVKAIWFPEKFTGPKTELMIN